MCVGGWGCCYNNGKISFDSKGLVPAIAQQSDTGEVLMMAWMNEDSIRETLMTNRAVYYSRYAFS